MITRYLRGFVGVVLMAYLGGCAVHYTPNLTNEFNSEGIAAFNTKNSVVLENGQESEESYRFISFESNLRECTEVVIATLRRELGRRDMSVVESHARSLKVSVVSMRVISHWRTREVRAEVEVRTGGGYAAKYEGAYTLEPSGPIYVMTVGRQLDLGLSAAVTEILKDPKIVEYLTK
jgi:hypothetical protein